MKDIEQILRENKPQMPAEDNFMIELNSRLAAVEGIKAAVAEQKRRNRTALLIALVAGLAVGGLITALVLLHPVAPAYFQTGIMARIMVFLKSWGQYLMLPVAAAAIAFALLAISPKHS